MEFAEVPEMLRGVVRLSDGLGSLHDGVLMSDCWYEGGLGLRGV